MLLNCVYFSTLEYSRSQLKGTYLAITYENVIRPERQKCNEFHMKSELIIFHQCVSNMKRFFARYLISEYRAIISHSMNIGFRLFQAALLKFCDQCIL